MAAITSNLDALRSNSGFPARKLDLAKYRQIMSRPIWGCLLQALVRTRSYEQGLDGALLLLRFTEENKLVLQNSECQDNLQKLYCLVLLMLDRADQWEDYLQVWESLFRNTKLEVSYVKGAETFHGPAIGPFIVRQDASITYVHFLWGTHHRKALIERKLARKHSGKKIGNLVHASPAQLTGQEKKRRLKWIAEIADTTKYWSHI